MSLSLYVRLGAVDAGVVVNIVKLIFRSQIGYTQAKIEERKTSFHLIELFLAAFPSTQRKKRRNTRRSKMIIIHIFLYYLLLLLNRFFCCWISWKKPTTYIQCS